MGSNKEKKDDALGRFVASLFSSGIAEAVTLPTDVAKTRLQVQVSSPMKMTVALPNVNLAASTSIPVNTNPITLVQTQIQYSGMIDCITKTAKNEGYGALWKGLKPALLRQCCYRSLSLVLYEPIRSVFQGKENLHLQPTFTQRLMAGASAGAISIFVFNWTEVIKTKMQSNTSTSSAKQLTMRSVVQDVIQKGGISSLLFSGVTANVIRTSLLMAAELGTYDEVKNKVFVPIIGDNAFAHLAASGVAGLTSASVSTPADVIKTRLMNSAGDNSLPSRGVIGVFRDIVQKEGVGALYKGFIPFCTRKIIWCSVFFVSYEQLRELMKMQL